MTRTVAVAAFNGVAVFELAVPCEVFGIDRSDMGLPGYDFRVCGTEPGPLRTQGGFTMTPRYGLPTLERADTIVVPAWANVDERPPERLLRALRRAHERGARIASLCTGAFVLAAAGLLDGRRATTHWMHAAALAERYPRIDLDPNVLYVDEGSVLTSAGTAAGIDLCLHMVRNDYGAEVANMYARRMVVPPHRDGGQAQFVDTPIDDGTETTTLDGTLDWALQNIERPLSIDDLAEHASMSPRTFARRFRAITGTTPLRWLVHQRVIAARRLLETTDLSIDVVADRTGFGSAPTMRLHFARIVGTSPQSYRQTFRRDA
jgi:transcriptional regulator GlxA family with amidase domain